MKITTSIPCQFLPSEPQSLKIPSQIESHADLGVAIGGIGAGGINRGASGGFRRWSIEAGRVEYWEHAANGFALWQSGVGGRALREAHPDLAAWHFDASGDYQALFPLARHHYQQPGLDAIIEQITPVLPAQADADLPAGIFRVRLSNTTGQPIDAAMMLSWANLCGRFGGDSDARLKGGIAGQFNRWNETAEVAGVVLDRHRAGPTKAGDGQWFIGCGHDDAWSISHTSAFDPVRDGARMWHQFNADGTCAEAEPWVSGGGFSEFPAAWPCAAVSAKVSLAPGQSRTLDFVIAYDLPTIEFGQGRQWHRHYTARWGVGANRAAEIAGYALASADQWFDQCTTFHTQAGQVMAMAPATTEQAINELYFLNEGLSVWTTDHFGLIECPDYPLYNTLDLWVYAASAIQRWFPELAQQVVMDYAREVEGEDPEIRSHLRSDRRFIRQCGGRLPHDMGAPNGDPFVRANDYVYQDSSRWKDLNTQFVLTAWRSVRANPNCGAQLYPACLAAMESLLEYVDAADGLLTNSGFPDQTFDNIPMRGVSLYCGGLWLAAMRAMAALAELVGETQHAQRWRARSALAEPAFERALWNGSYYRVDSEGEFSDAVFTEQAFGPMLARTLGLGDVVNPQHIKSALQHVFETNFVIAGQRRGAISMVSDRHDSSLYAPKGEEGLQWDEVLVGFNYSFAAQLRHYGLEQQAQQLVSALTTELCVRRGLRFRTPAAFNLDRPVYRAQMNMRPLAIWMLADHTR